jgi:hypothetical protein
VDQAPDKTELDENNRIAGLVRAEYQRLVSYALRHPPGPKREMCLDQQPLKTLGWILRAQRPMNDPPRSGADGELNV